MKKLAADKKYIGGIIEITCGFEIVHRKPKIEPVSPATCPHCGGKLKYLYSVLPFMMAPAGFG